MSVRIASFLLALLLGSLTFSCSKAKESHTMQKSILTVIQAFKDKDQQTLETFISKEYGVYTLYRRGVFDEYEHSNTISFKTPIPSYYTYSNFETKGTLRFEILPTFDCEEMLWSKTGIFCDTTRIDRLLSTAAQNLKKYREDPITDTDIQNLKNLEDGSHRVVLSDGAEGELIFYMTQINQKWFLTIIDRVSTDCSA